MIRTLLVLVLLANTLLAQDANTTLPKNWAQAIAAGALAETSDEPKIVMESIENCKACDEALQRDAVDLLKAGWVLKVDKVIPSEGRVYPRWRVYLKDGCSVIEFTRDFKSKLRETLAKRRSSP